MQLIRPTIELKQKALAFRQAHFDAGEQHIAGGNGLKNAEIYEDWLTHINETEAGKHEFLVPSSTYFAVVDDEIVGIVDIRHRLNDHLLKVGGHIGYSIHPSHRRKGYARSALRLALEKCRQLGIEKALVICDKDNIGSKKTILNNGGVFEGEGVGENGVITLRYWIEI